VVLGYFGHELPALVEFMWGGPGARSKNELDAQRPHPQASAAGYFRSQRRARASRTLSGRLGYGFQSEVRGLAARVAGRLARGRLDSARGIA
jgi:hypothetical protein